MSDNLKVVFDDRSGDRWVRFNLPAAPVSGDRVRLWDTAFEVATVWWDMDASPITVTAHLTRLP